MRTSQDLIVEDIRRYRDTKAAEYGYSVKAAVADFEKAHKLLMKSRGLAGSAQSGRPAKKSIAGFK